MKGSAWVVYMQQLLAILPALPDFLRLERSYVICLERPCNLCRCAAAGVDIFAAYTGSLLTPYSSLDGEGGREGVSVCDLVCMHFWDERLRA